MSTGVSQVKALRERTGAGILDCQKALKEAAGDLDQAEDILRKKGMKLAEKKGARVASCGRIEIALSDDGRQGVMLEVNCETDFVERNEDFLAFVKALSSQACQQGISQLDDLMAMTFEGGTVEAARERLIAKIGENILIRRVAGMRSDASALGHYVHGNRIGVLVQISHDQPELARDVAMHVAASRPQAIRPEDVSEAVIQKERDVYTSQAESSGKPAEIVAKMIEGKMRKFLDEVTLLGQAFVKNPDQKIADLLKQHDVEVLDFVCFEVGEGIEKRQEDFAAEVQAQLERTRQG